MSGFWLAVTDLGDAAVTLPLAASLLVYLFLVRWPRAALSWAAAIVACALAVTALKLTLLSCGGAWRGVAASPSGHAALAAAVYGAVVAVAGRQLGRRAAVLLRVTALAVVVAIGMSRVAVGAHTVPEVLIGMAIGALAAAAFHHAIADSPQRSPPAWPWLAAATVAVVMALHGQHWSMESHIRAIAGLLARGVPACVPQLAASSRLI
jgi:hypothetical protein